MEPSQSEKTRPPKPLQTILPVLGLVLVLVRVATCVAKEANQEERERIAESVRDMGSSPGVTCIGDCATITGTLPSAEAASNERCENACRRAKERMPTIDFPETYQRCALACVIHVGRIVAEAADGGAWRDDASAAGAAGDARTPVGGGAPSDEDERVMLRACVDECLDTLAGGGSFNPAARNGGPRR